MSAMDCTLDKRGYIAKPNITFRTNTPHAMKVRMWHILQSPPSNARVASFQHTHAIRYACKKCVFSCHSMYLVWSTLRLCMTVNKLQVLILWWAVTCWSGGERKGVDLGLQILWLMTTDKTQQLPR